MLSIGWSELLIVAAIALIVVGPRDLPVMLRHLGRAAGALRRMGNEFRAEIDKVGATDDIKQLRRSFADPLKAATRDINLEFNKSTVAPQPAPRDYAEAAAAKAAKAAEAGEAGEAGEAEPGAQAESTPSIAADAAAGPKSGDRAQPAAAEPKTTGKPKTTRKPAAKSAAAKPRTRKSASGKPASGKSTSGKSASGKSGPTRRPARSRPARASSRKSAG